MKFQTRLEDDEKKFIWNVEPKDEIFWSEIFLWVFITIWLMGIFLNLFDYKLGIFFLMIPLSQIPFDWRQHLKLTAAIYDTTVNGKPNLSSLISLIILGAILLLQIVFIGIIVLIYYMIVYLQQLI